MSLSGRRRKSSRPRRLELPILPSEELASSSDGGRSATWSPEEPPRELLAPQLECVLSQLSSLTAEMQSRRLRLCPSLEPTDLTCAAGLLADAGLRLVDALDCLHRLETGDAASELQHLPDVTDASAQVAEAAPTVAATCPEVAGKRRWSKDSVNEGFAPQLSSDGSVTLSADHPTASLSAEAYHRLLEESRGAATLHLRALLKHFFSRETLAQSSVTGAGTYKRPLDREIVMGVCDYIRRRYPGALTDSRMRLCCTDVCVQARRRGRGCRVRGDSHIDS